MTTQTSKYSDFALNFEANPFSGDIGVLTQENAVKQAIKNLVLTNLYGRPFQPRKAGNIKSMLFENFTPVAETNIKERLRSVIENFEPRADLRKINIEQVENNRNAFIIKIRFRTKTTVNDIELDIPFINRVS